MKEHISIIKGYIEHLEYMNKFAYSFFDREQANKDIEAFKAAIKALEQEPSRDMEEIEEVINCNADAETKCKMISNILTAKPHYF